MLGLQESSQKTPELKLNCGHHVQEQREQNKLRSSFLSKFYLVGGFNPSEKYERQL